MDRYSIMLVGIPLSRYLVTESSHNFVFHLCNRYLVSPYTVPGTDILMQLMLKCEKI